MSVVTNCRLLRIVASRVGTLRLRSVLDTNSIVFNYRSSSALQVKKLPHDELLQNCYDLEVLALVRSLLVGFVPVASDVFSLFLVVIVPFALVAVDKLDEKAIDACA